MPYDSATVRKMIQSRIESKLTTDVQHAKDANPADILLQLKYGSDEDGKTVLKANVPLGTKSNKRKVQDGKRHRRRNLSQEAVAYFKQWRPLYPFPNKAEQVELAMKSHQSVDFVVTWFCNFRKREYFPKARLRLANIEYSDCTCKTRLQLKAPGSDLRHFKASKYWMVSPKHEKHCKVHYITEALRNTAKFFAGIGSNLDSTSTRRSGAWTDAELRYVQFAMEIYQAGILRVNSLRRYLASELHCTEMRISKKFTGNAGLGSLKPMSNLPISDTQRRDAIQHLESLKCAINKLLV